MFAKSKIRSSENPISTRCGSFQSTREDQEEVSRYVCIMAVTLVTPTLPARSVLRGQQLRRARAPQSKVGASRVVARADVSQVLPLLPLGAAAGWALFNIGGPLLNQFQGMAEENGGGAKRTGPAVRPSKGGKKAAPAKAGKVSKRRAGLVGLGMMGMMAAESAQAAQEVAQVALSPSQLLPFLPLGAAAGWALFNIGGPLLNQFQGMAEENGGGAKRTGPAVRPSKGGKKAAPKKASRK